MKNSATSKNAMQKTKRRGSFKMDVSVIEKIRTFIDDLEGISLAEAAMACKILSEVYEEEIRDEYISQEIEDDDDDDFTVENLDDEDYEDNDDDEGTDQETEEAPLVVKNIPAQIIRPEISVKAEKVQNAD